MDLGGWARALDAGCGTGVLALALAGRHGEFSVDAVDRDALAVALCASNAALNRVDRVRSFGSLVLDARVEGPYDLAACNLPAKAGAPVLRALVRRLAQLVRPGGVVAVVVVAPLARLVRAAVEETGGQAALVEQTHEHAVFHYAGTGVPPAAGGAWLAAFVRHAARFEAGGTRYDMTTLYGLPDFDTVSYADQLALEALQGLRPAGRWGFWRPGQGHLAAALLNRHRGAADGLIFGGRDLLSLEAARLNALTAGAAARRVETLHLPFYFLIEGSFDFLALSPDDDPGWRWQEGFAAAAARLVRPGGLLLICGHSGDLARIGGLSAGFAVLRDQRRRGFRVLVLRRNRNF